MTVIQRTGDGGRAGDDIEQARACVGDGAGLVRADAGANRRWRTLAAWSGWDGQPMSQLSKRTNEGLVDGEDGAQTMALLMVIV